MLLVEFLGGKTMGSFSFFARLREEGTSAVAGAGMGGTTGGGEGGAEDKEAVEVLEWVRLRVDEAKGG